MTHVLPGFARAKGPPARFPVFLAACALVLAGVVVYWNSFHTPLVFDARVSIVENPTIRQFTPLGRLLLPPMPGATVEGRPMLNVSFAINYAFGKLDPWGYHVVNLAIHLLAGLALFGIVRRPLLLPQFQDRMADVSTGLALAVAVLWVVHPLQTESVTNIVQRAESLMGWLFLLTFYLSVRAFTSSQPLGWKAAAQQGKVEEAIAHYRKALGIRPDNAKEHYNLGIILVGQNRLEEAIAQFRKALEIQPDYAKARDNLDRALRLQRSAGESSTPQ